MRTLLGELQSMGKTILISSHVLRDIEQVVDWVICLDRGRICADTGLDKLQESYASWQVTAPSGDLPDHFEEDFVLSQTGTSSQAQLLVRDASAQLGVFERKYRAEIDSKPLNLEQIFPHLLEKTA